MIKVSCDLSGCPKVIAQDEKALITNSIRPLHMIGGEYTSLVKGRGRDILLRVGDEHFPKNNFRLLLEQISNSS